VQLSPPPRVQLSQRRRWSVWPRPWSEQLLRVDSSAQPALPLE
jgi:hypothetical protein